MQKTQQQFSVHTYEPGILYLQSRGINEIISEKKALLQ